MSKARLISFIAVVTISLSSLCYVSYKAFEAENTYRTLKTELVEVLNWEDRLLNVNTWLFPSSEWEPKKVISEEIVKDTHVFHERAVFYGQIALGIVVILILITYFFSKNSGRISQHLGIVTLLISFSLLFTGVASPMLEIEVYEDDLAIPIELETLRDAIAGEISGTLSVFGERTIYNYTSDALDVILYDGEKVIEGRMYFYYQNKSALGVMNVLMTQENYFVLVALVLFSFIIPFLKLTVSIFLLYGKNSVNYTKMRKIIGYLGKLSMGDVFVASIYLSYLSFSNMNAGISTNSQTLVGIYFFTGYVLLSIFSYFLIENHLKLNYYGTLHQSELAEQTAGQASS